MPINPLPIYNENGLKQKIGDTAQNPTNPTLSTGYTPEQVFENTTIVKNFDLQLDKINKKTQQREAIASALFGYSSKQSEIITLTNQHETDITTLNNTLAEKRKATATEYFNKNADYFATPELISNDVRLATFSAGNNATGLTQVVAIGGSYNILTSLLEANEVQAGNITIVYQTIASETQSKILVEANDKFLFPSNLNTFNLTYVPYLIHVVFTVDIPDISNNLITEFSIVIRRVVDNSAVATASFFKSTGLAVTDKQYTAGIKTFVNSETDPFVVDGCYLSLENSSGSATQITLKSANVRIFKD